MIAFRDFTDTEYDVQDGVASTSDTLDWWSPAEPEHEAEAHPREVTTNPFGHPPGRREKQAPPPGKRIAKRRRKAALAKHHKKAMRTIAAAKRAGKKPPKTFPKRPAK